MKQNSTTIAQYIWSKKLGTDPNTKWELQKYCKPVNLLVALHNILKVGCSTSSG